MADRPTLERLGDASPCVPDDTTITPGSTTSGYSITSHCQLLRGKTEQDEYVQCRLQDIVGDQEEARDCGIGKMRPVCLQRFARIKIFVVFMCLLLATSGTLSTGYLNSVITTIEKRFEIGSSISGLIAASYEFGSLVAVIFISYLGGRRSIPKWIGCGVIFMGIGALFFSLPHIIAKKYTVHEGIISDNVEERICKTSSSENDSSLCIDENSGNWIYVLILVAAQVLIGTGGTPILTLGTTYIDDHVSKEKAPQYLAFIYATGALGPVMGYALGALLLQYYVDMFSYNVEISPAHPHWIGAWWGGFLICGVLLLVLAIPFLAFPRILVKEKRKILELKAREELFRHDDKQQNREYGKTIKDIPQSLLRLLKNSIYMITCFGICCEVSIVCGFVVFLPKYLETQFGTTKSVASLFTGGIGIPGAVIGILLGGFLLKRFQLRPKGAIQLTLLIECLALVGFIAFFFVGCDNLKIAGATFPYFNSSGHKIYETNLTSSCNLECDCSPNDLEPICGINGITYFSPCHAGCTEFYSFQVTPEEKHMNFSQCSCIMKSDHLVSDVIISPLATSGPCMSKCQNLLPFLILLVVMTFCVAGTQMPLLMVTLRSVREEERCFALGVQFVILRLFAYIPAPIMFGNTIDTSCLLWRQKCGYNGSCLVYDIVQFRYKYVGISAGLKLLGTLLFFIVWLLMRRRCQREKKTPVGLSVRDMMNSMNSINKMDLDYDQRHSPRSNIPRPLQDDSPMDLPIDLNTPTHNIENAPTDISNSAGNPEHTDQVTDAASSVYTCMLSYESTTTV